MKAKLHETHVVQINMSTNDQRLLLKIDQINEDAANITPCFFALRVKVVKIFTLDTYNTFFQQLRKQFFPYFFNLTQAAYF